MHEPDVRRTRPAATSCGLDRDQFILYIVELHEAGMRGVMLEMKRYCLKNISTKFLPGLCLGEDGMAQRAREITAFLSIVNFEDQFHASRIPEAEEPWHVWALRNQVGPKVCRVRVGIRGFLYGQLGDQGVVRPSELALPLIPPFCPQPQIFDAIPPASTLKAPSIDRKSVV